MSVMEARF